MLTRLLAALIPARTTDPDNSRRYTGRHRVPATEKLPTASTGQPG